VRSIFILLKEKKMFQSALFCGAVAGFVETTICHPLDTIKTRIQNRKGPSRSFASTLQKIYTKEGFVGFYRGLGIVYTGVVPKNAIRFGAYEAYSPHMPIFMAGILAGATEAVVVVNPMDVLKVRLQAQFHSLRDPSLPSSTLWAMLKQEGWGVLFRGMGMTVLRQGINQGSNFTLFHWLRQHTDWGSFVCGCCSGAVGPVINNPLDVIKTRLQASASTRIQVVSEIYRQSGWRGFYLGLGARLLRIVPGQGITFLVYDWMRGNSTPPT
jgi:solute carrier family 25 citrate transporter 1